MFFFFSFDTNKETLKTELCFINKLQIVQIFAVYSLETCFKKFQFSSKACIYVGFQVRTEINNCPSYGNFKLKYQEHRYSGIQVKPEAQQSYERSENEALFLLSGPEINSEKFYTEQEFHSIPGCLLKRCLCSLTSSRFVWLMNSHTQSNRKVLGSNPSPCSPHDKRSTLEDGSWVPNREVIAAVDSWIQNCNLNDILQSKTSWRTKGSSCFC